MFPKLSKSAICDDEEPDEADEEINEPADDLWPLLGLLASDFVVVDEQATVLDVFVTLVAAIAFVLVLWSPQLTFDVLLLCSFSSQPTSSCWLVLVLVDLCTIVTICHFLITQLPNMPSALTHTISLSLAAN